MHRNDCYRTLQGYSKKLGCATGLMVIVEHSLEAEKQAQQKLRS
jgi:ferritin-like metal-binding protein YciE